MILRWLQRRRAVVLCAALAAVTLTGCVFGAVRAVGIPGAASRTPDFVLPLSAADRNLALLYLDKKRPPRGQWEQWGSEEVQEELKTVAAETRTRFAALLDALARTTPQARDLEASGTIGTFLAPPGATDEALDARFRGQIMTGDLRVGTLQEHYFIFYRRYPHCEDKGTGCKDVACPEGQYCRLVIVHEVATRKE